MALRSANAVGTPLDQFEQEGSPVREPLEVQADLERGVNGQRAAWRKPAQAGVFAVRDQARRSSFGGLFAPVGPLDDQAGPRRGVVMQLDGGAQFRGIVHVAGDVKATRYREGEENRAFGAASEEAAIRPEALAGGGRGEHRRAGEDEVSRQHVGRHVLEPGRLDESEQDQTGEERGRPGDRHRRERRATVAAEETNAEGRARFRVYPEQTVFEIRTSFGDQRRLRLNTSVPATVVEMDF